MSVAHNVSIEATASGGFVVWYGRGRVCRIRHIGPEEYQAFFTDNGHERLASKPAQLAPLLAAAIAFQWE